jgi:ubiquinone/menaquinone biosynthesis C-methylase UbiE
MSVYDIFRPMDLDRAKGASTGFCNGIPGEQRYNEETPLFASAIIRLCYQVANGKPAKILDFGCGPGRLAKAILDSDKDGVAVNEYEATDISYTMRAFARMNVNDKRFVTTNAALLGPVKGGRQPNVLLVSFVLQHMPAVRLYPAIRWMWDVSHDRDFDFTCTRLVVVNSKQRLAITKDGFVDDGPLGVDVDDELSRGFEECGQLFTDDEMTTSPVVNALMRGQLQHTAKVYRPLEAWRHIIESDRKEFDKKCPD